MKKLVIVSMGKATGQGIARQINDLIGEYVEIETVLMSEAAHRSIEGDLILFTSDFIAKLTLQYLNNHIPYLIAQRVINHKNIKEVISIPMGTEVLLVNDGRGTALEAIEQLIAIGLDHIQYHPFYPGCGPVPRLEIAITPGEAEFRPHFAKKLIDIGTRILDIKTIHEIVALLELEEVLKESLITGYIRDIVEISKSIDENRRATLESEKLLGTILDSVEHGIALVDELGVIISVNSKFESIFAKRKKALLAKRFDELLEDTTITFKDNKSYITEIEAREVLIDIRKIEFDRSSGYLITLSYTDKISKLGHKIRRNHERKINRKLYTFDDYLSTSGKVKEMLIKAHKFSKTEATILIQGENGTGKEILAQAIHMNSHRRKNLFIPINITAVSSTLLESELFGYEEGAFTGALKGGKRGLFEIASGGTIFIDEIGDAPLDFQVKLLRVLEEKRIRRVGGIDEIPIDVRIIAATNKNLLELVDQADFREDLFFRLNILPLKTIPLRERREDIRYLLKYFVNINFGQKTIGNIEDIFTKETLALLEDYRWRGNVRELINLVEYLSLIYEGKKLESSSLHQYMLQNKREREERILLDASELWVLETINKNSDEGIGRTTLAYTAKKEDEDIGEGKIRSILKKLEQMKLIKSKHNKKGCTITEKGMQVLSAYNQ